MQWEVSHSLSQNLKMGWQFFQAQLYSEKRHLSISPPSEVAFSQIVLLCWIFWHVCARPSWKGLPPLDADSWWDRGSKTPINSLFNFICGSVSTGHWRHKTRWKRKLLGKGDGGGIVSFSSPILSLSLPLSFYLFFIFVFFLVDRGKVRQRTDSRKSRSRPILSVCRPTTVTFTTCCGRNKNLWQE